MYEEYDISDVESVTDYSSPIELEEGVVLEHLGEHINVTEFSENDECNDTIAGTPEEDIDEWHEQLEPNSCAISCQTFIAEQLLNTDFSEAEMICKAKEMGIYNPESGTPASEVGDLLENLGLYVDRQYDAEIIDISQALEDGEKIICGVNAGILNDPELANIPGIKADHAVQVIGVDYTNPENVQVILNDPGVSDGQGIRHDLDTFMKAWDTSGNYTAFVDKGVA